jgi:hypothetical protein
VLGLAKIGRVSKSARVGVLRGWVSNHVTDITKILTLKVIFPYAAPKGHFVMTSSGIGHHNIPQLEIHIIDVRFVHRRAIMLAAMASLLPEFWSEKLRLWSEVAWIVSPLPLAYHCLA